MDQMDTVVEEPDNFDFEDAEFSDDENEHREADDAPVVQESSLGLHWILGENTTNHVIQGMREDERSSYIFMRKRGAEFAAINRKSQVAFNRLEGNDADSERDKELARQAPVGKNVTNYHSFDLTKVLNAEGFVSYEGLCGVNFGIGVEVYLTELLASVNRYYREVKGIHNYNWQTDSNMEPKFMRIIAKFSNNTTVAPLRNKMREITSFHRFVAAAQNSGFSPPYSTSDHFDIFLQAYLQGIRVTIRTLLPPFIEGTKMRRYTLTHKTLTTYWKANEALRFLEFVLLPPEMHNGIGYEDTVQAGHNSASRSSTQKARWSSVFSGLMSKLQGDAIGHGSSKRILRDHNGKRQDKGKGGPEDQASAKGFNDLLYLAVGALMEPSGVDNSHEVSLLGHEAGVQVTGDAFKAAEQLAQQAKMKYDKIGETIAGFQEELDAHNGWMKKTKRAETKFVAAWLERIRSGVLRQSTTAAATATTPVDLTTPSHQPQLQWWWW